MNRRINVLSALACAMALGAAALTAHAQTAAQPTTATLPTISASGSAIESRSPDQAEVSLGVQATGRTSAEAQDLLNRVMEKVIKAVKETNLPGLTCQSQGIGLYPEYEREGMGRQSGVPKIIGYRATNSIRVKVGDVNKVGTIIDVGTGAGANQVHGVTFSLKNDAEARREAIKRATADAKAKAEAVAEALGVRLGRVVQATTGGAQVRPYRFAGAESMMMTRGGGMDGAPTPVEAGEVDVSADVTVEFAIVDQK